MPGVAEGADHGRVQNEEVQSEATGKLIEMLSALDLGPESRGERGGILGGEEAIDQRPSRVNDPDKRLVGRYLLEQHLQGRPVGNVTGDSACSRSGLFEALDQRRYRVGLLGPAAHKPEVRRPSADDQILRRESRQSPGASGDEDGAPAQRHGHARLHRRDDRAVKPRANKRELGDISAGCTMYVCLVDRIVKVKEAEPPRELGLGGADQSPHSGRAWIGGAAGRGGDGGVPGRDHERSLVEFSRAPPHGQPGRELIEADAFGARQSPQSRVGIRFSQAELAGGGVAINHTHGAARRYGAGNPCEAPQRILTKPHQPVAPQGLVLDNDPGSVQEPLSIRRERVDAQHVIVAGDPYQGTIGPGLLALEAVERDRKDRWTVLTGLRPGYGAQHATGVAETVGLSGQLNLEPRGIAIMEAPRGT